MVSYHNSIMNTDNLAALKCPICDYRMCVDFRERGKPEYPGENPQNTGKINCGNSLTLNARPGLVSVGRNRMH